MMASAFEEVIPVIAVCGGLIIALIMVIGQIVKSTTIQKSREQSRREIAAYVAEGSMTADEGAKLLDAGLPVWERGKR